MDIRKEILQSLDRTGQTRSDLIRATGICRDSVYRYLSGRIEVSAETAGQLLEAAGCGITQPRAKRLAAKR